MKRRTLLAAASAAFFSSACGGGGSDGPRVLALHGDSLEDGTAPWGKLEVIPGRRLAELLPDWIVRDYATAAETLPEAYGEVVIANGKPLPLNRLKYDPMPEHIEASDATHMVMRYGGADCLLGTPMPRFVELLTRTVELAHKRDKVVLLASVYDHPSWNFRAYTDAAREVANRERAAEVVERVTVQTVYRDRFITNTIKEIEHAAQPLAVCPVPADAVRLLNDAARCAREDRPAACGADGAVQDAG